MLQLGGCLIAVRLCIVFLSVAAAANNQPSISTANPGTGAPQLTSLSTGTAVLHGDKGDNGLGTPNLTRRTCMAAAELAGASVRGRSLQNAYLLMEGSFSEQQTSLSLPDSPSPAHGMLPVPRSSEE